MSLYVARVGGVAGLAVGVASALMILALPAPLVLCILRPPFHCIAANLTGTQYFAGDSPAAFWWLSGSLVGAPLISLVAVRTARRGHPLVGLALSLLAVAPGALYLSGHYALMPFHPMVFAATLVACIGTATAATRAL